MRKRLIRVRSQSSLKRVLVSDLLGGSVSNRVA